MRETYDNTIRNSIIIFLICLAVHSFEVLVLRTDESFFAECFVNKVVGIIILYIVLSRLGMRWSEIGFVRSKFLADVAKGFCLCIIFYGLAFAVEFAMLAMQGNPAHLEFFVTGFSLTGDVVKQTGVLFVLMCIGFNVINVWMEEGLFRGFFITYMSRDHAAKGALIVAALLFGIWHLVTPFRSLLDGDMTPGIFLVMSIGYVILSAVMGIKWGMLYQYSGAVWIGMADHFFNNCVMTNLLHVVSVSGVDELQIMRVLIAELASFVAVYLYIRKRKA